MWTPFVFNFYDMGVWGKPVFPVDIVAIKLAKYMAGDLC